MKAVSLFTGVGGMDLAFERAGVETVLQAERDEHCRRVLERHWPQVRRVSDVRDVTGEGVQALLRGEATGRIPPATERPDGEAFVVQGVRESVCARHARSHSSDARSCEGSGFTPEVQPHTGTGGRDAISATRVLRDLREGVEEPEGRSLSRDGQGKGVALSSVQPTAGGAGGSRVQGESAEIFVVHGGFPCQPFSVAGRRLAEDDERDGWPEFRRVVSELWPIWVVAENVPGLLSVSGGRYFGQILEDLVELGYGVAWGVRDAQFFGVAQRRRRVFIVGTRTPDGRIGAERAAQVLAICESCGGHPETGGEAGEGTTGAIAVRTAQTGSNGWGVETGGTAYTLDGAKGQAVLANPLGAHHWSLQERDAKGVDSDTKPGHLLPAAGGVRRLTPLECERLQGFPSAIMLDMDTTRDEIAAVALAAGHLFVDFETGYVYRTRGQRGRPLDAPVRWGTSVVNGYYVGTLRVDAVRRQVRAHRVVWIAAHGVPPAGMAVCHRNNIKTDNRLENLYLAEPEENSSDAARDGLYEHNNDGRRVLSEEDYQLVIDDYHAGDVTIRQLADKYGVSKSRVHQIVKMAGWTEFYEDGTRQADSHRYRQMGNAVAVPVVEWIARRLVAVDAMSPAGAQEGAGR